ncbi:UvrD-helicase domain-containing protein [Streptomyces sp. NPDC001591]|uniref:UvrD-helicase domain-containing protein n=1 Tax=Streptomyces sp. NPDC001591 TaxID=3364589 RepID=UPI0036B94106
MTVSADITPTPDQRAVITLSWEARALVTARAGSGKTTTLTHRIEYLTGAEGLEASEVLALTFSRGAVRALREKVDTRTGSARRVRAQTFDGWALAVLKEEDPARTDLPETSYDQRIEMATEAIEQGVVEASEHGAPAHIILDEVQDLVGVRRDMVEALFDRLGDTCGFTVVGDPAQSIYGFQVSDPVERAAETNRFFDWVRVSYADDVQEFFLDRNFRTRTPEARIAPEYGQRLAALPRDIGRSAMAAARIHNELRAQLAAAPAFGTLEETFVRDSLREFDGTTAVLCRDNAQVLRLSEDLNRHAIPHRVQTSSRARPTPAWVAGLLTGTGSGALTEQHFRELPALATAGVEPDRAWRSLRRAAAGPRNTLDLSALRSAVAGGRLPDELTAPAPHPLVVSTIHRAKGLEFDRVLITEPEPIGTRGGREDDPVSEARLLYVAMTRPRDDIFRIARPDIWPLRLHAATGRWYAGGHQSYVRAGIEAGEFDVGTEVPGGVREPFADPAAVQRILADEVRPGDPVSLRRLHSLPSPEGETPPFGLFHRGRPIGEMSRRFRSDLWRLLRLGERYRVVRWPSAIEGMRVELVETVVGSPSTTTRHGLGDRGAWLVPRLYGLGRFDWTDSETLPERSPNP